MRLVVTFIARTQDAAMRSTRWYSLPARQAKEAEARLWSLDGEERDGLTWEILRVELLEGGDDAVDAAVWEAALAGKEGH